MRVRADPANILRPGARKDRQLKHHVHVHFGDDDEGVAVREGIQRRVDAALDGVLDRDHRPVGLASAYRRERMRGARHGKKERAGGRNLVNGLFGKGAEWAQERDA